MLNGMRDESFGRLKVMIMIALTCLVPLLFVAPPSSPTMSNITLYVSALTGYAGMAMLVWMYVLGTRSLVKHRFGDIAGILKMHGWLGKYGTLAIFAHPIFVMLSYGETLLYVVAPQVGTQFENHVTLGRLALYFLLVIWLTSAIVRGKIADRPWKYIHYLSYLILPFAILHVPDVGSTFMTSLAAKGFVLFTVLAFLVSTLFRLYALAGLDRLEYQVRSNVEINPGIFQLTLAPTRGAISPAYGQFVFIRLGLISEDHAFSVVYTDPSDGTLVLTYKRYRMFTREMSKLRAGATVTIDGPYGKFTSELASAKRPIVFVAGGIGITPFVSHLFSDTDTDRWLFYTAPSPENAAYLPELRRRLGGRVIGLFQNLPPDSDFGEKAWVSMETFSRHLDDPIRYDYYLCGPPDMLKAAERSIRSIGVSPSAIHKEEFAF